MRKHATTVRVLLMCGAALGCALFAIGASRSIVRASGRVAKQTSSKVSQLELIKSRGLEAAASVTGQYIGEARYPRGGGPANVTELLDLSPNVVLAHFEDNRCALSRDGKTIFTFFNLRVDRVLKGRLISGDLVTLVIWGGKVVFANGASAELTTTNFAVSAQGRILVFLRPAPTDWTEGSPDLIAKGGAFITAAGPLGLFDLDLTMPGHKYVMPAGSYDNPMAMGLYHEKISPDAFVTLVQSALAK